MKKLFISLTVISMFNCSNPKTSGDEVIDTLQETPSISSLPTAPLQDDDSVQQHYDDVSKKYSDTNTFYEVSIETQDYEAMSTTTWHFDSLLSYSYFKEDWSMEGQEGSSEYFLQNGRLICSKEEESTGGGATTVKQACEGNTAITLTWNEGEQQPIKNSLPNNYLSLKQNDVESYYRNLISILTQNDVTEKAEDFYTIKIENVINVGEDFTERTEVKIPKTLYEKLVSESRH